jgi:GAF domain-containing protein
MDRRIRRLPGPVAGSAHGERRRSRRQKLFTPVYASFNGPQTGLVVDFSELLDLHEDGFALQTSGRLQLHRAVTLCLDLPETNSLIHGSGQVIWSDASGRAGIQFSTLTPGSRKLLREWLFANLLVASSNHAARTEQLARREGGEVAEPLPENEPATLISTDSQDTALASEETLHAIPPGIADPLDAELQIIVEHALFLTGAGAVALALLTDDKMICRARIGELAPPLGTPLNTGQGLSGECVRTARLVSCEDAENDASVDPGLCRSLGIASLMAVPVLSDSGVIGLLEVFSSLPHVFTATHALALDKLVEMIPNLLSQCQSLQPENAPSKTAIPIKIDDVPVGALPSASSPLSKSRGLVDSPAIAASIPARREAAKIPLGTHLADPLLQPVTPHNAETAPPVRARLLYRALLGLTSAMVVIAAGYSIGPVLKNWVDSSPGIQQSLGKSPEPVQVAEAASTPSLESASLHASVDPAVENSSSIQIDPDSTASVPPPKLFADLRKLAEQGDADAQWRMGILYHDGEAVAHDDTQAVQWFRLAAEHGHIAAQGALGAYYWRGRGVPEDLSKAYFWSAIAMAQGDEMSKSRIAGLSSQMTREQVSVARQQAEAWIHSHTQRAKSSANLAGKN